MKGDRQETTYMDCEAKLGSKRRTHATGTPETQEKIEGHRGWPVDCTVRMGCKATTKAGIFFFSFFFFFYPPADGEK